MKTSSAKEIKKYRIDNMGVTNCRDTPRYGIGNDITPRMNI
jgi:hypothetical protein